MNWSAHERYLLQVLILALFYWASALVGFSIAPSYAHVTSLWLPAGIGLAALLVFGVRLWPGALLGAVLFTQTLHVPWPASLLGGVGDMLSSLVGAVVLKYVFRFDLRIASFRDAILMVVFGALLPTLFGGSIGTLSLYLTGLAPTSTLVDIFKVWWLADMAGALTLAPLLLALSTKPDLTFRVEGVALFALLSLVCAQLFRRSPEVFHGEAWETYFILPFVVWAALRFDLLATASVVMIASVSACLGSLWQHVHEATTVHGIEVLHLQVFMAVLSSIGLLLSAATRQQRTIALALHEDVLQRERAEEGLRLALSAAHMGAWTWEIDSGRITFSESMDLLHGLKPGELSGLYDLFRSALVHEDIERVDQAIADVLGGKAPSYDVEYRIRWPDGAVHWMEASGQVFRDRNGEPVRMAGVVIDITDRKHAEAERERLLDQEQRARIEAEKSVRARDVFLAAASHELRTPLTPLKLHLQSIKQQLQSLPPEVPKQIRCLDKSLEVSNRQLDRLTRFVNDLLDVSRISAGRLVLHLTTVDLSHLCRDMLECFKPALDRAGCAIRATIENDVRVAGDAARIEQVLTNLLGNAMKYGRGKPIDVRVRRDGKNAVLTVQDRGIGIAKEDQERIFQQFERTASIMHFEGMGLGLFITREIVQAHAGTIRVESEPDAGSAFVVELPLAQVS